MHVRIDSKLLSFCTTIVVATFAGRTRKSITLRAIRVESSFKAITRLDLGQSFFTQSLVSCTLLGLSLESESDSSQQEPSRTRVNKNRVGLESTRTGSDSSQQEPGRTRVNKNRVGLEFADLQPPVSRCHYEVMKPCLVEWTSRLEQLDSEGAFTRAGFWGLSEPICLCCCSMSVLNSAVVAFRTFHLALKMRLTEHHCQSLISHTRCVQVFNASLSPNTSLLKWMEITEETEN